MSVIIAYRKNNVVYMGTDTRITDNGFKTNELCECNYKICLTDDDILVGITTADRVLRQTISIFASKVFTLNKNGYLTKKHIVTAVIPELLELLAYKDLLVRKDGKLPKMNASILLAHKGNLYEICSGFQVFRYRDFQAIGRVSDFGHSPLLNAKKKERPNTILVKALDIIAKHNCLVGRPYVLIDTKKLKYTLVGGDKE